MNQPTRPTSPLLATLASFLIPGAGYLLLGQRQRALLAGGGIILLFALGMLIAGVRVISVPGYDEDGYLKYIDRLVGTNRVQSVYTTRPCIQVRSEPGSRSGPWLVTRVNHDGTIEEKEESSPPSGPSEPVILAAPLATMGDNLSFLGQMLAGPMCGIEGWASISAARHGIDKSYSRLADIGSLYTAVAGMLNLLVIVDTYVRASRKEERA